MRSRNCELRQPSKMIARSVGFVRPDDRHEEGGCFRIRRIFIWRFNRIRGQLAPLRRIRGLVTGANIRAWGENSYFVKISALLFAVVRKNKSNTRLPI